MLVQASLCLPLLLAGCSGDDGDDGLPGAPGDPAPTDNQLSKFDDPPGVNFDITGLSGGTGAGGNFLPGDLITVEFTLTKDDGSGWDIDEMGSTRMYVSGPTQNYNRVITQQSDVGDLAVHLGDGTYRYTFPAIPDVYAAPYNDTATFDEDDGELTGQNLLDGTYTVSGYMRWTFEVEGESLRDADDDSMSFLLGNSAVWQPREVVKLENCNACHVDLALHGNQRSAIDLCLACHTSGGEDRNNPLYAGGTPDITIDFKVMIHKIHNGVHLPSVNGVATNPDGSRNYAAGEKPYEIVGFGNSIHDYSHVAFPAWPNLNYPMPRDLGYDGLTDPEQDLEDEMRRGVTNCDLCHGDPDGAGPLTAPADGDLAYTQPTRKACGSCHDDIDWDLPYVANNFTMDPQPDDSDCITCHDESGSSLSVRDGHLHPLFDPGFNAGINLDVSSVVDRDGGGLSDDSFDLDDRIEVTFSLTDDMGADIDPADMNGISVNVSGPTHNANLLLNGSIPLGAVTGGVGSPAEYTLNLPEKVWLEDNGTESGGASGDVFGPTSRTPHWDALGAATEVRVVTGNDTGSSTLAADATARQNYVDVLDASGFADDDYVSIGGATTEYMQIQDVDLALNRLWFASPYQSDFKVSLEVDHAAGATVQELVTVEVDAADYTVNDALGTVTEDVDFPNGTVLITYTSDFLVPATYQTTLNASPDLDETVGEWDGKSVEPGTYLVNVWATDTYSVGLYSPSETYRWPSKPVAQGILVGGATEAESYELIDSEASCMACHVDLMSRASPATAWPARRTGRAGGQPARPRRPA
jgi:OmcA/MtrC family decaheme c-type cytochrome